MRKNVQTTSVHALALRTRDAVFFVLLQVPEVRAGNMATADKSEDDGAVQEAAAASTVAVAKTSNEMAAEQGAAAEGVAGEKEAAEEAAVEKAAAEKVAAEKAAADRAAAQKAAEEKAAAEKAAAEKAAKAAAEQAAADKAAAEKLAAERAAAEKAAAEIAAAEKAACWVPAESYIIQSCCCSYSRAVGHLNASDKHNRPVCSRPRLTKCLLRRRRSRPREARSVTLCQFVLVGMGLSRSLVTTKPSR